MPWRTKPVVTRGRAIPELVHGGEGWHPAAQGLDRSFLTGMDIKVPVAALAGCPPGSALPGKAVQQNVPLKTWPQLQTTPPSISCFWEWLRTVLYAISRLLP